MKCRAAPGGFGPSRALEPGSKLLISGLYRDYIGSLLKGYYVDYKEF